MDKRNIQSIRHLAALMIRMECITIDVVAIHTAANSSTAGNHIISVELTPLG
ncbi:hypothetical protein D1605_001125 [Xylella fastidiosa subsp. fastidiosa]|uniref:Uncharacterized protein n=1 Tax=Xylella fastidiosa subsp. fastidiosa TaxID=644356 RepID=A0AAJ5R2L7_XYLFS|nr:hypothetical protein [Xylella fastidiosa]MBE0266624.1 hypothetical protein [Xylella fastidiosa subsp. fastidiosa]MBE0293114.1 hypothetical protein [Xylella fastidiosa subsp. fastidiosa]MBE7609510.1 hypothetical protein [Xylella fastidiosa subsp. fastidiosa]MDC7963180.1 hypothetical protein [Xylella fastidiosa]QID15314.1 hypothetical protein FG899_12145 [Xylella fastidiosa subsp. fastidiosa]